MKRVIVYLVVGALIVIAVAVGAGPARRRFNELRSDQALINGDTGDVMASATYQRFTAQREAIATMRSALLALAAAESLFVADSGRPTTSFMGRYAFVNHPSNLGPSVELQRDRWIAKTGNLHTPIQCTLTAMLDTVTWRYHPGAPSCAGWTSEEQVAAETGPQAQVIDRGWNPELVNNTPPRLPWILSGICPGGYCRFGQWTACSTTVVKKDKGHDSPAKFTLALNEEFTALTADVHVEQTGLVVFRNKFIVPIEKRGGDGPVVTILRLSPADTLYPLVRIADRQMVWWFRGTADTGAEFWRPDPAVYRPDALKGSVLVRSPVETWWIRIRNSRAQEGWALYDPVRIATVPAKKYPEVCQTGD